MAKKAKRAAPAVACQNPSCTALVHPRSRLCDTCGTEQHRSGKKKKVSRAARSAVKGAVAAPSDNLLVKALQAGGIEFVVKAGGISQAKKLLGEIERHVE